METYPFTKQLAIHTTLEGSHDGQTHNAINIDHRSHYYNNHTPRPSPLGHYTPPRSLIHLHIPTLRTRVHIRYRGPLEYTSPRALARDTDISRSFVHRIPHPSPRRSGSHVAPPRRADRSHGNHTGSLLLLRDCLVRASCRMSVRICACCGSRLS